MPARVKSNSFVGKDFAQASRRLDVRYYLVAILFKLFSVDIAVRFSRAATRSGVDDFSPQPCRDGRERGGGSEGPNGTGMSHQGTLWARTTRV
jgi:hypothetical protein